MGTAQRNIPDQPASLGGGIAVARLLWVFIGPLVLMLLLVSIMSNSNGWFTGIDIAYFIVLALTIGSRWIEARSDRATTIYGEPATWGHFQRYVLRTVPLWIGCWIVANFLGNYLWRNS